MAKNMEQIIAEAVQSALRSQGAPVAVLAAPATLARAATAGLRSQAEAVQSAPVLAAPATLTLTVRRSTQTAAGYHAVAVDAAGVVFNIYAMRADSAQAKRTLKG